MRGSARRLTEELRSIKDRSGLSLTQIGTRTHYSKASWERWFNGKRVITEQALESLAANVDERARLLQPLLALAAQETGGDVSEPVAEAPTPAPAPARVPAPAPSAAPIRRWSEHLRRLTGSSAARTGAIAVVSALLGAVGGAWLMSATSPSASHTAASADSTPVVVPVSASAPPTCQGVGCAGKDPQSTGCVSDVRDLITQNIGTMVIYLHYSARCKAAWGALTDGARGDTATIATSTGDHQTALVHWGYDNYSMMVDAGTSGATLQVCGTQPAGHGCTPTVPVPVP
ncbi:helix-turn-helix domain-containing protein [Streptacidiphilus fuscans]|uniref:DUF2690 domain-containing protein n=1 Tax=Streptacidiphilus fuscans TaxID=2789292 RepID=A0A931BE76_9ACTN|nr:XRE family transcriptional regulator [Streptacidiphilus fuscans]MBF9073632.1 DUF2690 domain-containing protein [Streptacidiphilus fuscans]